MLARLASASRRGARSLDADAQDDDDFTVRAVLVGLLVGCLVAFTNLSLGLQSGWTSMMSLQSALLGFGVLKVIPIPSAGRRPFSAQENAVLQATAVAVGSMPLSAGFVGIIPALNLLEPQTDGSPPIKLNSWQLLAWSIALAYFGVFFASPLRPALILKEKLPFPSGTATAQLISILHNKPLAHSGAAARRPSPASQLDSKSNWQALIWSFTGSAIFTISSFFVPVLYALPIFDAICPGHNAASMWGWWFTPSLSYIGQGIIMGLPTSASMTLGAFVGWAILSPVSYYAGWAPDDPLSGKGGSKAWLMWIALAIMCSESILGLVALLFTNNINNIKQWLKPSSWFGQGHARQQRSGLLDTGADRTGADLDGDTEHEPPSRLTSTRTVVLGLTASTVLAIVLIQVAFKRTSTPVDAKHPSNTSPGQTLLAIGLALILSLLGARALGATDLNPVSGLGKISQLVFALTSPGNVVANLIAGGISEAGAMAAGDMLQDYKTGHLVGSAPHSQFKGQLVGSTLGIFVSMFAYQLYAKAYPLPGPQFPVPSAGVWLNLARLLNNGHLPPKSGLFMTIFAVIFAVSGILRSVARVRKMQRGTAGLQARSVPSWEMVAGWLPNGIAFAVGILNTPNFSLARLVGGLIGYYYLRHVQRQKEENRRRRAREGLDTSGDQPFEVATDSELAGDGSSVTNTPDERTGLLRRRGFVDGHEVGDDADALPGRSETDSSANHHNQGSDGSAALQGVFIIVIASGLVLGEGAASIITLLLKQAGFQPLTCFGCRGGCSSC